MIVFRRRLFFWLLKAYIKRLGKRIFVFFLLGLILFFLSLKLIQYFLPKIPIGEKESIGLVGAYTVNEIPMSILLDVSYGLTMVSNDGSVKPAAAKSWEIKDAGKTYVFHLKDNLRFTDGSKLSSKLINYSFTNVKIDKANESTIEFRLKESYSPFLITVSSPIFKKGFVGLGEYKLKDLKRNGEFVKSVTLALSKNPIQTKTYIFYPTQEALKTAFVLGEAQRAIGLSDINYQKSTFESFNNVKISKKTNYQRLATLFYNAKDPILSDTKIRNGLTYAIPDIFNEGVRNYSPFSPDSWAYTPGVNERKEDLAKAAELISESGTATGSSALVLSVKTLPRYITVAQNLANIWKTVGIDTKIEEVDSVPASFQIFLGDFRVPRDPDQYVLWHKDQENNITRYNNQRIDKLLEDGRKTSDLAERKKIYADFEKYLLADSPASFLYFPYEYEISRR